MQVFKVLVAVLVIIKASSAVPEPLFSGSLLTDLLGAPATPPTTPPPTINPSTTGTAGATAFSTGAGIVPTASSLLNGILGVGGTLGGTVSGLAPGLGGVGDLLNLVAGNTGVAQQLVTLLLGGSGAVCSNGTLTTPSMLPGLQGLLGLLADSFSALFNGIQQIINSLLDLFASGIPILGDNCCNSGLAAGIGNALDDLRNIIRPSIATKLATSLKSAINTYLNPSCALSKATSIATAIAAIGTAINTTTDAKLQMNLATDVSTIYNKWFALAGSPSNCAVTPLASSTVATQSTSYLMGIMCSIQVAFNNPKPPATIVANMPIVFDIVSIISGMGSKLTSMNPASSANFTSAIDILFSC